VIGVGRAGRARVEALRADPRAEVVIGHRGDPAALGLPAALSLHEVIGTVDAVAICSPDAHHPDQVRAALEGGCHVVCEAPLAGSAAAARALFDLATERERVLHVEHIELLTPSARFLEERCSGRVFEDGSLRFQGETRRDAASVVHANVARLHRVVDALGLPTGHRTTVCKVDDFSGVLEYPEGELEVEFAHLEGLRRHTEVVLRLDDGSVTQLNRLVFERGAPVSLPRSPLGLFVQDQLAATARILDGARPYVTDERVVAVLALADALASAPLSEC